MSKLTDAEKYQLITFIRDRPAIWNIGENGNGPNKRNARIKEFEAIASEMNKMFDDKHFTGQSLKMAWRVLQICYYRESKRSNSKWQFLKEMQFMGNTGQYWSSEGNGVPVNDSPVKGSPKKKETRTRAKRGSNSQDWLNEDDHSADTIDFGESNGQKKSNNEGGQMASAYIVEDIRNGDNGVIGLMDQAQHHQRSLSKNFMSEVIKAMSLSNDMITQPAHNALGDFNNEGAVAIDDSVLNGRNMNDEHNEVMTVATEMASIQGSINANEDESVLLGKTVAKTHHMLRQDGFLIEAVEFERKISDIVLEYKRMRANKHMEMGDVKN